MKKLQKRQEEENKQKRIEREAQFTAFMPKGFRDTDTQRLDKMAVMECKHGQTHQPHANSICCCVVSQYRKDQIGMAVPKEEVCGGGDKDRDNWCRDICKEIVAGERSHDEHAKCHFFCLMI